MNAINQVHKIELPPLLSALGGGFYMGLINHNGQPHAVIRAPKALGHFVDVMWHSDEDNKITGANSYTDGLANTTAMAAAGSELAQKIRALDIDGTTDWALPARDQLEIMYRAAKPNPDENYTGRNGENPSALPPTHSYTDASPAQVSSTLFQLGGAEAFEGRWYWSSTQYSAGNAWGQLFDDGTQDTFGKSAQLRAFAVRMIPVIE